MKFYRMSINLTNLIFTKNKNSVLCAIAVFHYHTLVNLWLTSGLFCRSTQQLVKDVESPLIFGLAGGPGLFEEVWIYMVMDV